MTAQGSRYQSLSDSNYVSIDTRQVAELTRHKDGIMGDRRVFHIPVMVQVGDTGHYYKVKLRVTVSNFDTAMKAARVSAERFHTMDEGHFTNLYVKKTSGPQSFQVHKLGVDTMGMIRGQISGSDVDPNKVFSISVKDVRRAETIAFNIGPTCIGHMRLDKFFLRDVKALKKNLEALHTKAQNIVNIRRRAARRIDVISGILQTGRENGTPISRGRRKDYQEELTNLRQQVALIDEKLRSTYGGIRTSLRQLNRLERFYQGCERAMAHLENRLKAQRRDLKRASSPGARAAAERRIQRTLDSIRAWEDHIRSRESQLTGIHNEHTRHESAVADMSGEKRKAPEEPKKPGFFGSMMQNLGVGASGHNDQFVPTI